MRLHTLRSGSWAVPLSLGALLIAIGCGSNDRSGFGEEQQSTDPTIGGNGDGTSGGPAQSSGGFGGSPTGDIEVDPKNTTIIIDSATNPATPAELLYKVMSKGNDVTGTAKLELEKPVLGSFAGAKLTTAGALPGDAVGVSTMVKATLADGVGLARLTIVKLRKTGPSRDFFFVEPYMGAPSPKSDTLEFGTSIKQVDVAFSMDTTGSMTGSINNLKTALSGTLLTQLQASIPNVGLAIVDFRDYPVDPYGSKATSGLPPLFPGTPADWPMKVHQKITTTLADAVTAVGKYSAGGGGDGPEADIPSMQHILTGEALSWSGGSVAAATNAPGTFGGVDFRPGSVPVVVNITDIDWHGAGHTPYNFATPTMDTLKTAFTAHNAFFVDITSGDEAQANELSDATNSNLPPAAFGGTCGAGKCCTGANGAAANPTGPGGTCRLNFRHSDGNGVSSGVAAAIKAISVGASYDVKAVASNDPKNAKGVDATKFIQALRAMDEGNAAQGCPANPASDTNNDGVKDTFLNVIVGTKVCFEVIPAKNTTVTPENEPQFYNAFVDVIGVQGNIHLDNRSVLFLVPPKDPGVN